ncbi:PAS domain-containing sensor histidine kinase [Cytophagaceae bacterium ABcell3]|nr:PAS domain-containing sensor histidine kinase [Cytophagaceae bacterium ABcell3]
MDDTIFHQDHLNIDTNQFFKFINENSQTTCILIMDAQGVILDSNLGFQKNFGYAPNDLRGKHLKETFLEKDRLKKLPEIELEEALLKGHASDNNYLLHKDGSKIFVHGESISVKDNQQNSYIIKILYDINQQKLLEKHLKESQQILLEKLDELQRLNEELDTFVYAASHDLKAPISNIEALIQTLQEDLSEESKKATEDIMGMVDISLQKLRNTVIELASTAKAKIKTKADYGKSNFQKIFDEVKISLLKQIQESHATLNVDFSKAPDIYYSGKNLRSIIFNLLSNAIKYRHPQRNPNINISSEKEGDYIVLKISDNGLGIKKEDQEKVFEIYSRIYTHVEGSGVGMAIVAKMVRSAGGKIEIDSRIDKGTEFRVYIPQGK